MRKILLFIALFWSGIILATGCSKEEADTKPLLYEGPLFELDSVRTLYSDSAIVRVKLEAPKQYEFESGDREFPIGLYIEFFEPDGSISATMLADYAFFFSEEQRYTAIGNVEVESLKENNKLLTDTLHWSVPEQKVYTKSFVKIIEEADTLTGHGLEAADNFSYYTILQPDGSRTLEADPDDETAIEEDEDN